MRGHGNRQITGTVLGFWVFNLANLTLGSREDQLERVDVRADPDSIVEIAGSTGHPARDLVARFDRGACCVCLQIDGVWATAGWVSTGPVWVGELATWFTPRPSDVYVWDCGTRSQFRGRGLYPRLLQLMCRQLAASGRRRVWIATEWRNWRSGIGIARSGFSPVGAVVAIQSGAFTWRRLITDSDASDEDVDALTGSLGSPRRTGHGLIPV